MPEGYTTIEYYFILIALSAVVLFTKIFLLYLYYGLIPTLIYVVYRVFLKRKDSLRIRAIRI